jgi:hypothetical protein
MFFLQIQAEQQADVNEPSATVLHMKTGQANTPTVHPCAMLIHPFHTCDKKKSYAVKKGLFQSLY